VTKGVAALGDVLKVTTKAAPKVEKIVAPVVKKTGQEITKLFEVEHIAKPGASIVKEATKIGGATQGSITSGVLDFSKAVVIPKTELERIAKLSAPVMEKAPAFEQRLVTAIPENPNLIKTIETPAVEYQRTLTTQLRASADAAVNTAEQKIIKIDEALAKPLTPNGQLILISQKNALKGTINDVRGLPIMTGNAEVDAARMADQQALLLSQAREADAALAKLGTSETVVFEEGLGKFSKADLARATEKASAEKIAAETAEVAGAEVGGKAGTSLLSKVGEKLGSKGVLYAGIGAAAIVGVSATVGIVSAAGLGSKPGGVTQPDAKTPAEQSKIDAARDAACGTTNDWINMKDLGVDPLAARNACRECIVTGSETEKAVTDCFQAKYATMLGGKSASGGGAGGAGDGSNGATDTSTPAGKIKAALEAMCADSSLSADQQKICKDCLASKYTEGTDYATQEKYDAIVGEIQTCFAEKSKAVASDPHELCNDASFTSDEKAKCNACVDSVDTSGWATASESTKSAAIGKIQECFTKATAKTGTTADICEDPGLDAATKSLCKTCQGKVTDPQSVEQVAACIQASAGTTPGTTPTTPVFGSTSPCDDPAAQLTDDQYVACVACYSDGMTIEALEDCIIEKVAKNTGTVPVCDSADPSFNLTTCMGKICDPSDVLYNQESCDYLQGTVERPYCPQGEAVVDTMDPCDTTSQMFDATACANQGGEVYTSAVQAEAAPSPFVPVALAGLAAALMLMGFRSTGKPPVKPPVKK